uniref:UPAR/Ly6 domain-containing protein n=1 Tax=Elaeophora elaphi TaxID=1147741 RepID=A0A0R3RGC3_9BILA
IFYTVQPDSEETCEKAHCEYDAPKCLTDVLRAKTVLIQMTCCCANDFCNYWLRQLQYKELNVKSKYFTTLFHVCLHPTTTFLRFSLFGATKCVRNFDFRFGEEIFVDERKLISYKFDQKTVTIDGTASSRFIHFQF